MSLHAHGLPLLHAPRGGKPGGPPGALGPLHATPWLLLLLGIGTLVQTQQPTGDRNSANGSARLFSPTVPHTRSAPSREVEASRDGAVNTCTIRGTHVNYVHQIHECGTHLDLCSVQA